MRLLTFTLLALVACESPGTAVIDGRSPDGPPPSDAETLDARQITVTVHVRSLAADGAPDPTATVFLAGPDGALAGQVTPDASGTATGTLPEGGSVTVGWHDALVTLVTVLAVEDGDDLTFGPGDTAERELTVTLPTRAGANLYEVDGPCFDGTNSTATVDAWSSHACGPTRSLLATSRVSTGSFAYLIAPAVTPTDGGTLVVTGTWAAGTTATVDYTGLPLGAGNMYAYRQLLVGGFSAHRDSETSLPISGGTASATYRAPVGYGETVQLDAFYAVGGTGYTLSVVRPTLTETAPLDVAPTLPDLSAPTQTGATVTWTTTGSGPLDAVVIDLHDETKFEQPLVEWRLIAPPTATSVTVPDLPAPFDVATSPLGNVRLIDSSTVPSYAVFRAQAGAGLWIDDQARPAAVDTRWTIRYR